MTSTTHTPSDRDALAALLADATANGTRLRIRGTGTRSRRGLPLPVDAVLDVSRLDRITAYEPADLTLTVEAGASLAQVNAVIHPERQTWPQAPEDAAGTVGGVLASATSSLGRLRWGPVRDSVLEVVVATGSGRLVRAGGRTVKGVAGYDIPRLMVGAMGTLGVIVEVTLKLWPTPESSSWFRLDTDTQRAIDRAEQVLQQVYRPAAVVVEPGHLWVRRDGVAADVVAPEGMSADAGPEPTRWNATMRLGVRPSRLGTLLEALSGEDYRAQFGVGLCDVAVKDPGDVPLLRDYALRLGGFGEVIDAPDAFRDDPWGPVPAGISVMRRMRADFDPAGVLNPGMCVEDFDRATVGKR